MIKNGVRLPLTMAQVFPHGCHLMPDSIAEAQDYDEKTKTRSPAIDKITGRRVFQCRVADMDPELEGRSRETVVKILADRQPVPPTGQPFELVEFDNLQVTPYRHAGNDLAAASGATLRELMARMGHSTTWAALIYLHDSDDRQRKIAESLDALLREQLASGSPADERGDGPGQSGTNLAQAGEQE
jgi:hypothetical protein